MVRLYAVALKNVGVDSALTEKLNAVKLLCFLGKDVNKLLADNLALGFGVGDARKLVKKTVYGIHIDKVCIHLVAEDLDDLLRLALAQQTVVNVHADELFADRLDEQRRDNGRVNAAGECKKHLLIAYLSAKRLKLLCNESLGKLRRGDALHGFGALVICHMVILQYLSFYTGIIHSPPRIGKRKSNSGTRKIVPL